MAAAAVQEIQNVLPVCGISALIYHSRLIYNKGFNSLKYFGVMDGGTDVLDMVKRLVGRSVVTCMNLEMFQIKGLQALFWWI